MALCAFISHAGRNLGRVGKMLQKNTPRSRGSFSPLLRPIIHNTVLDERSFRTAVSASSSAVTLGMKFNALLLLVVSGEVINSVHNLTGSPQTHKR